MPKDPQFGVRGCTLPPARSLSGLRASHQLLLRRLRHVSRDVHGLPATLTTPERDVPVRLRSASRNPPFRGPLDAAVPAGRTVQGFPITIGEDELKGFRRPIFFDASASHVLHSSVPALQ
jgi:hypothetical protein